GPGPRRAAPGHRPAATRAHLLGRDRPPGPTDRGRRLPGPPVGPRPARPPVGRGSACTRVVVGAESEHGESHERVRRTEGTFTPPAIADRVRWQLDGWLAAGAHRPSGGLTRLWLAPDEVVPAGGRQLAFGAGGPGAVDAVEAGDRAVRALARVQGLLGGEAVQVPEWRGGRGPGDRVGLVAVDAADVAEPRPAARPGWVADPWPGAVPDPAPATVHPP